MYVVGKIDRSHEVKTGVQPGLIQLFFPLALISYTLRDNRNSGLTGEHILPKTLLYMYKALWPTVFLFYYHQKRKPNWAKIFPCSLLLVWSVTIIRRVKNLSSWKIKISVYCKVITFSNLFLHCCGEAGHGMISLDYCLNFQAGVVIVHVSEYKLHESIYRWSDPQSPLLSEILFTYYNYIFKFFI